MTLELDSKLNIPLFSKATENRSKKFKELYVLDQGWQSFLLTCQNISNNT